MPELCSSSVQFSSVAQLCPTLCDPMNCSTPGPLVHHQLPKFTQTHVHRVGDAIQPSHALSSPFPPAPNPSLPGAGAPPMAKIMRKEARHMQRWDRASGVPLEILEHLPPKPESACFVLSPTPLTLWGAVPHYLSLKKELTYNSS